MTVGICNFLGYLVSIWKVCGWNNAVTHLTQGVEWPASNECIYLYRGSCYTLIVMITTFRTMVMGTRLREAQ